MEQTDRLFPVFWTAMRAACPARRGSPDPDPGGLRTHGSIVSAPSHWPLASPMVVQRVQKVGHLLSTPRGDVGGQRLNNHPFFERAPRARTAQLCALLAGLRHHPPRLPNARSARV